jgi:hypothetical protein
MTDAYKPALDSFVLDAAEEAAVAAAMTTAKPWAVKNDAIKSVKAKIRALHLARHGNTCCYCRTILQGGGHFMIDREHVLPKKKYKPFTYTIWNLSVACKRCNMQFKGEGDCFVKDKAGASFEDAENYDIVHPNYDEWESHLDRQAQQSNRKLLVKYRVIGGSAKGSYTYDYFALKDLEIDSFDEGQGIEKPPLMAETDAMLEARAIAREFGQ